MKEPSTTLAYALGQIDAAYIADAELPELTAAASCPGRAARRRTAPRFLESGWFAAAISATVAVGVLVAIILAGQRDPLGPPIGTSTPLPTVTETQPPTETLPESPHTVPEGFAVTDAVYDYRGDTVILLHVTSEIQENVFLTVQVYYPDEEGNPKILNRQRVKGFPAGHEKYFMIRTDKELPSYSYTITAEPYDGECLEQLYHSEFSRIYEDVLSVPPYENGDPCYDPAYWEDEDMDKTYPGLLLEMTSTYLGDVPVDVTNFCIVFDNSGEIFYITETENSYHYRAQNGRQHTGIYVTREDTMTWPEELLGDNVTAIRIYSIAYSDWTFPDLP